MQMRKSTLLNQMDFPSLSMCVCRGKNWLDFEWIYLQSEKEEEKKERKANEPSFDYESFNLYQV